MWQLVRQRLSIGDLAVLKSIRASSVATTSRSHLHTRSSAERLNIAKPSGRFGCPSTRAFRARPYSTDVPVTLRSASEMTLAAESSQPVIKLSPMEDALCEMLVDACDWIEEFHPQPDAIESAGATVQYTDDWTCEARIAGGWVRDKILGIASHDLDISLSSLTGHVFALLLRQYLFSPQFSRSLVATRVGSPLRIQSSLSVTNESSSTAQLVSHITKIAANPEQSKNLETATARVAGLQLDFVNLRKDMYEGDSRIPAMAFGTALEDAERRDITINALFYNIRTREVEDWTKKGLSDLRQKLIRTPLDPRKTFLDDPLRVLRVVRFASRFGYDVDDTIFACLTGEDGEAVRHALTTKVSRERFGQEVDKMMLGPNPSRAIEIIERMHMYDVIFGPPPGETIISFEPEPEPSGTMSSEDARLVRSLTLVNRAVAMLDVLRADAAIAKQDGEAQSDLVSALPFLFDDYGGCVVLEPEKQRLFFYSAILLPLNQVLWEERPGRMHWAGACVISNGIRRSIIGGRRPLTCMWRSATLFHRPTQGCFDSKNEEEYRGSYVPLLGSHKVSPRVLRALLLRHPDAHRSDLHVTPEVRLVWTLIADLSTDDSLWLPLDDPAKAPSSSSLEPTARMLLQSSSAALYVSLYDQLKAEGNWERIDEPGLLNGKELQRVLGIKPSTTIPMILKRVETWQFDRDITEDNFRKVKGECIAWLVKEWESGGIVPFDER